MGNSAILSSLSNYKLSTMLRLLSSLLLLLVLVVNIQAAPSPGFGRGMAVSYDDTGAGMAEGGALTELAKRDYDVPPQMAAEYLHKKAADLIKQANDIIKSL